MSSIPSSAMPHAKTEEGGSKGKNENQKPGETKKSRGASIKEGASKLKDKAKENPKTAIAAGAAVVAAAVGAAALGVRKKASGSKAGTSSKSSASKSTSKPSTAKAGARKTKSSS